MPLPAVIDADLEYLYGPAFGPFTQLANALHLPAPVSLAAGTMRVLIIISPADACSGRSLRRSGGTRPISRRKLPRWMNGCLAGIELPSCADGGGDHHLH